MSVVGRYYWYTRTPVIGFGIPARDFIVHLPVGRPDGRGGGCNRHSTCVASVTEVTGAPGHPVDFPFIGHAWMTVFNVAPRDDGIVDLWVHVEWHEPLNLRVSLVVVNP